ncbi:MAG: tRNA pseudouridine(38-40) synthase TruA [Butyricicoccus sp.]|nr:tRNA pseudouridine(38-40) synthase TruA [Butyricicoccus sp.]
MTNFVLTIAYDGSRYHGWQRLGGGEMTIQGKLERVIGEFCGHKVEINGAGRTDAGVHARGQVANVPLNTAASPAELMAYCNRYLPEDIAVTACAEAPERFHARLNAKAKRYTYRIRTADYPDVFGRKYQYAAPGALNLDAMRQAAAYLIGKHDFKAFCGNKKMKKSTVREIYSIEVAEENGTLELRYHGDGFLQYMIRILSGTLLEVGQGVRAADDLPRVLTGLDRAEAGPTLPARGLTLEKVEYS